MRCVEALLVVASAVGIAPFAAPGRAHEVLLESGARIVVIAPAAGLATELPADEVAFNLALPFGWADDQSPPGSGMARLAADALTHVSSGEARLTAELLPTALLLHGNSKLAELEGVLTSLLDTLTAATCDDARFTELLALQSTPPVGAVQRFREAAAPQSPEGFGAARRSSRKPPTKEELLQFFAARCGCEGAMLALVTATDPAPLALAAGRVLERLPRAKGVAAPWIRELPAARARRVEAPTGATMDVVGFRVAWSEDPRGDRLALAAAFLAEAAASTPLLVEHDRQGGLIAFAEAPEGAALSTRLAQAVAELHGSAGLDDSRFRALLARMEAANSIDSAAAQARALALAGVLHSAPLAAEQRVDRWRQWGRAQAQAALRELLRPQAQVDVIVATADSK